MRHSQKDPRHRQQQYFLERLLTDYDWRTMNKWLIMRLSCPRLCVCSNSCHSLYFSPHLSYCKYCNKEGCKRFQEYSSDMENIWHLSYPESITSQRHQCFNSIKGNFEIFPNQQDHLLVCVLWCLNNIIGPGIGSGINSVHFHIVLRIIMTKLKPYHLKTYKFIKRCFAYTLILISI